MTKEKVSQICWWEHGRSELSVFRQVLSYDMICEQTQGAEAQAASTTAS